VNFSERRFSLWGENNQQSAENGLPLLYMGLGQVRDLRRKSVKRIVAERKREPFMSLRDLLARVPLQTKEALHLVQCGALDGLGESRAAMVVEVQGVARAGSAAQMAFDFVGKTAVPPETLAEQLQWETYILGWPISVNPIATAADQTADDMPIHYLPRLLDQRTTTAGVRLPGWTGGSGFFLGDGTNFVIARLDKRAESRGNIKPWQPLRLSGFWRQDEWGGGFFAADVVEILI
ncbi:MAG: hypothetical protein KC419_26395, partial [Anaerolineales bacterium]|nr:hypothetical protein [Anaerolineales bacterium]